MGLIFRESQHKKKQEFETNTNYKINIPRPHIIAKYQQEMGWVDRHNRYRQGILGLPEIWKTRRWQTRIQLELLGVTLVDSFLASLHVLPKWQMIKDEEQGGSLFWKFVIVLLKQLDQAANHETIRDEVVDLSSKCVQVRLGEKKIMTGVKQVCYAGEAGWPGTGCALRLDSGARVGDCRGSSSWGLVGRV
jgi:hypothetical protein